MKIIGIVCSVNGERKASTLVYSARGMGSSPIARIDIKISIKL